MAGADDYLLNYTFDLSLDDHLNGRSSSNHQPFNQASCSGENFLDELNETNDQVDNLLEELNEFAQAQKQAERPAE